MSYTQYKNLTNPTTPAHTTQHNSQTHDQLGLTQTSSYSGYLISDVGLLNTFSHAEHY
jgi:hypothetical protein